MSRILMLWSVAFFLWGSAASSAPGSTSKAVQDWRMSWPDADTIEHFLQEANVVEREAIGTGITKPEKVTLELDGVTRYAVFKRVHSDYDSWRFEIGAYRLDKLLGLGLVPPTVERRLGFRKGCLQLWVEGETIETHDGEIGNIEEWRRQVSTMWLFDDLMANVDRHLNNAMVSSDHRLILIDHSKSFQSYRTLLNDLDARGTGTHARFWRLDYEETPERYPTRYPQALLERLGAVSDKEIRSAITKYVGRSKVNALLERREMILERLGVSPTAPERR